MEYYVTQPKDYWIAPNAVSITLNALGNPNRIQCSVASGAVIMCFIESIKAEGAGGEPGNGDGLWYGSNHEPKMWPLTISPTYFNSDTHKYVYVAIPRSASVGLQAIVVFPSEQLDIYGRVIRLLDDNSSDDSSSDDSSDDEEQYVQVGSTDYFYVWLNGIIGAVDAVVTGERRWEDPITDREWGLLETAQGRDEQQSSSDWYSWSAINSTVTFLRKIFMSATAFFQNLRIGSSEDDARSLTGIAISADEWTDSDTMVATPGYLSTHYLSKSRPDTAQELITFLQGLQVGELYYIYQNGNAMLRDLVLHAAELSGAIGSDNFVSGLTGWHIDHNGNMEAETLHLRSALEVDELRINRQLAQEGDTIFSDNDQIESVEELEDETDHSISYILTLKEKWEGYFTAQQVGNVIRGKINTLAAKEAGVSDYSGDEYASSQQTDAGGNKYYTSFMRCIATNNTAPSLLNTNQIQVVLYGDNNVPMGRNYPPCALMAIARWGCALSPDEQGISADEKEQRRRRQSLFMLSTSDGRIVKLRGVSSPILQQANFGVSIGELPEFVNSWTAIKDKLVPGYDYLFAQGVVVSDFIPVTIEGKPNSTTVNCGDWIDGKPSSSVTLQVYDDARKQTLTLTYPIPAAEYDNPNSLYIGHGIYLNDEHNNYTQRYEIHTVRCDNGLWLCLQHQPVISGGVATFYKPKWNSPYWRLLDGNGNLSIEFASSNGFSFRREHVDTLITPHLFYGNVDITDDVAAEYWSWTRTSESGKTDADRNWDANHAGQKTLSLTNADMPVGWASNNKAIFTCTVSVNDGQSTRIVDNQIIS